MQARQFLDKRFCGGWQGCPNPFPENITWLQDNPGSGSVSSVTRNLSQSDSISYARISFALGFYSNPRLPIPISHFSLSALSPLFSTHIIIYIHISTHNESTHNICCFPFPEKFIHPLNLHCYLAFLGLWSFDQSKVTMQLISTNKCV